MGCKPQLGSKIATVAGYELDVVGVGIRAVDGLAGGPLGTVFSAHEFEGGGIERSDLLSGAVSELVSGLDHPDGVAMLGNGHLRVREEVRDGRAVEVNQMGPVQTFGRAADRARQDRL